VTIKVSVTLLTHIFDIFIEEMKVEAREDVSGALYTFNIQHLSGIAMPAFQKNGGSPLEIMAEDGRLASESSPLFQPLVNVRVSTKLPT
jgi:hypothetical protein